MTDKADRKSTSLSEKNQKVIREAKKQFFGGLFDLSWRLFLVFLIPVAAGVWLDSGGDGTTFTMLGILLGTLSSVLVIKKVVSETTAQGGKHE